MLSLHISIIIPEDIVLFFFCLLDEGGEGLVAQYDTDRQNNQILPVTYAHC
jgi:hypothetical protein